MVLGAGWGLLLQLCRALGSPLPPAKRGRQTGQVRGSREEVRRQQVDAAGRSPGRRAQLLCKPAPQRGPLARHSTARAGLPASTLQGTDTWQPSVAAAPCQGQLTLNGAREAWPPPVAEDGGGGAA